MISSKTSFIALIGNPVSHSLSPIMQNAAFQYLGLDLIYIAIPCKDEDLELVLNSLKKINCIGLNITIPHKEKVFNLCSEISPIASKLKAINTLKLNSEKEWSATNTDVEGFIYPLKTLSLRKKDSIILGSGGAARSVIQGLINHNFSTISVISRNKSSLDELIKNFGLNYVLFFSPALTILSVIQVFILRKIKFKFSRNILFLKKPEKNNLYKFFTNITFRSFYILIIRSFPILPHVLGSYIIASSKIKKKVILINTFFGSFFYYLFLYLIIRNV